MLAMLLLISAGLLALERLNHPVLRDVRWRVSEWLTPVLTAAVAPLEPVRWARRELAAVATSSRELDRLRAENRKLSAAEARAADLERQMAALSALARVVPEHAIPFVSARVVATSSGIFVRSLSINAGRDDGVRSGYPVVGGEGLVGRVVDAGTASARVLLLTDLSSRVPVLVGKSAVRAILMGDNSQRPRLEFVAPGAALADGDEVVTSGVGGIFPRELRVGRVAGGARTPRVEPYAALDDLEFVSVLYHQTALGDLDQDTTPSAAIGAGAASRAMAGARGQDVPERAP